MLPLGILEVACTLVYLIPRTSILGAILLTGYLGGATATHVRLGEAFIIPVLAGVLVCLWLFFRDARLRALIPLRRVPKPLDELGSLPVRLGVAPQAVVIAVKHLKNSRMPSTGHVPPKR